MSTQEKCVDKLRICKYSQCEVELTNPRANTCCDAHRKAWRREQSDPDRIAIDPDTTRTPGQDLPGQNTADPDKLPGQTTRTSPDPDKTTRPEQPIDSDEVHILRRADLGKWRYPRPLYLDKPTGFEHLSDYALVSRLTGLNPWQGSPEYAERVYRLVHGLTDFMLPANMAAGVA